MRQIKNKRLNIVDENQTRIHATLVIFLIGIYLFIGDISIIYILIYDFFVRIYVAPFLSPLYIISLQVVRLIGLKQKPADELAKEFASHIGLTILFIILFAEYFRETHISFLLIVVFGIWKAVEIIDSECVACKFYELLKHKGIEVVSL
ncbi:DUF4395 domain-containing protein [Sulfurimonas sp.]|uniref:DUF4395 domain-containing protein n=1 Tax=Sulfurimonas sp. TaxID=2022749 RepID=UPI00261330F2|nr:DUF4395 domain-containing protein [Sulfurimonas sp.]MDD5156807.1 DUF4395 domain-containing protein [Sulfurimonas sp.]